MNPVTMTIIKLVFDQEESIAEKGENSGHGHFILFPWYFQEISVIKTHKFMVKG